MEYHSLIKWRIKKEEKIDLKGLDSNKLKLGTMANWTSRADYYHANWVMSNTGPFKVTARLADALEIESDDLILDVACGTGAVYKEILNRLTGSGMVVGVDLSRTAVSIANSWISTTNASLINSGSFIQMDAENIGFKNGIFDKVACQFALSFFPDPVKAMKQVRKVMKARGKIGIVVHGTEETVPYLSTITKSISKHVPDAISKRLVPVYRHGRPEAFIEVLSDAEFSDVSILKYTFQYQVNSFEEYWSEFFLNGYGNALKSVVFDNNSPGVTSKIRADAEELASHYKKNSKLQFPWDVLVGIARS